MFWGHLEILHCIRERVKTIWGLPSMDKPYLWEKFWNHLCIGELLWSFMSRRILRSILISIRSSGLLYVEGIEFFFCMEIISCRAFWGHSDLEVFLRLLQRGPFEFLNENTSWKLISKAKLLRSYINRWHIEIFCEQRNFRFLRKGSFDIFSE